MYRLFCLLILVGCTGSSIAQDYIAYQQLQNRVDEDVLKGQYEEALPRIDSLYREYPFVYAKHCIKALQICVYKQDEARARAWLEKCFLQGIPLWYIRHNSGTQAVLTYPRVASVLNKYDSLHQRYESSHDAFLIRTVDSLLQRDTHCTYKVNEGFALLKPIYWLLWKANNRRQLVAIKRLVKRYGYPGERLIGLDPFIQDSTRSCSYLSFYGPSEIRQAAVQIMLQHCYSTAPKYDPEFQILLNENLKMGNMPSFQYGIVMDFMCRKSKRMGSKKFLLNTKNPEPMMIQQVNMNRHSIGLNSYEEDNRNDQIELERRKHKTANMEIMVE